MSLGKLYFLNSIRNRRTWCISAIFAGITAFINFVGMNVYELKTIKSLSQGSVSAIVDNAIYFASRFALFFIIFLIANIVASMLSASSSEESIITNESDNVRKKNAIIWLICSIILFSIYLVVYLAYFPGVFSYDVYMQLPQALSLTPLTAHHPVLHTMIIRVCFKLGDLLLPHDGGVIVYSLVQMAVVSCMGGYLVKEVLREFKRKSLAVLVMLYYSLFPTFALFSFIMIKDVYFAVAINVFTWKIYIALRNREKNLTIKEYVSLILWGTLAALLRNNFVYVLPVVLIFIVIFKKLRVRWLIQSLIAIILVYLAVTAAGNKLLNVQPGPVQEKLSIPINQLSFMYVSANIPADEKEDILKFIPDAQKFNLLSADLAKLTFNGEYYAKHKSDFIKLWMHECIKYPNYAVKAFLYLNIHYWYRDVVYPDPYNNIVYIESEHRDIPEMSRTSYDLMPGLHKIMDDYSHFQWGLQNYPITKRLFMLSFPFYAMMVYLSVIASSKNTRALIYLSFFILYWLTFMLGPISNARYLLPFYYMLPVGMWVCLFGKNHL